MIFPLQTTSIIEFLNSQECWNIQSQSRLLAAMSLFQRNMPASFVQPNNIYSYLTNKIPWSYFPLTAKKGKKHFCFPLLRDVSTVDTSVKTLLHNLHEFFYELDRQGM